MPVESSIKNELVYPHSLGDLLTADKWGTVIKMHHSGAKQAAENSGIRGKLEECVPQGLKPIDFFGFIGTTKTVPCYKASEMEFFRSL